MSFSYLRRNREAQAAPMAQATNEVGFALCRAQSGQLTRGPVAEGTPVGVNIPVSCPSGTRFVGLFHTHPGGVAAPSDKDLRAGQATGSRNLCILVPESGELACYRRKRP